MPLDFELVIGPQFNSIPKCGDIWSSIVYFSSIDSNLNNHFTSPPIAYFVYGFKNYLIVNFVQNGLIRFISSLKIFENKNEKISCLSFSKNDKLPILFVGSITGHFLIYNLKENTLFSNHKCKELENVNTRILSPDWLNANNLFFSVESSIVHWNINYNKIKIIYKDLYNITCLAVSKCKPFFLAFGNINGWVIVLKLDLQNYPKIFNFNMKYKIFSLSFSSTTQYYPFGLLAAVAKNGHLKIWDLSTSEMIVQEKIQLINTFDSKSFLTLSFLPLTISLAGSQFETYDDHKTENTVKLIFSTSNGTIKLMNIFNSDSFLCSTETTDFTNENNYHTSSIINFSITNIYNYQSISKNLFKDPDSYLEVSSDSSVPLIAISLSLDKKIILWDLKNLKALSSFYTIGQTRDMAFSPHHHNLLAIANFNTTLWKLTQSDSNQNGPYDLSEIPTYIQKNSWSTVISWHPLEKNILAIGTMNGGILTWNITLQNPSTVYSISKSDNLNLHIYTLNWGPEPFSTDLNNLALYCVSNSGSLNIIAPHNKTEYEFNQISDCTSLEFITDVSWRSDFQFLAVGYNNGSIEIYANKFKEGEKLTLIVNFKNFHFKLIQCMKWHPFFVSSNESYEQVLNSKNSNVELFATSSKDTIIKVLDLKLLTNLIIVENQESITKSILDEVRIFSGHLSEIVSLSWCPLKIGILASCSYDNTVQIWDVIAGVALYNFRGHYNKIYTVVWSPTDSDLVISGGKDYTIQMWRPSVQKFHKPPQIINVPFSPKTVENFTINLNEETNKTNLFENSDNKIKNIENKFDGEMEKEKEKKFDNECREEHALITHQKKINKINKSKKNVNFSSLESVLINNNIYYKKKSLIPLANVIENCSTKQQHLEDIKFMMSQNSLMPQVKKNNINKRILIFGDNSKLFKLIDEEINNHLKNNNTSFAYQTELTFKSDFKKTIRKAIQNHHLTDWMVAMSASVSKTFYNETVKAFCEQLQKNGDDLLAATYLISIFEFDKAIQLLIDKHLFKEAIIIAKSRLPSNSPLILNILINWAKEKESTGNLEMAAKILISIQEYEQAGRILAKRENDSECQNLSAILLAQNTQKNNLNKPTYEGNDQSEKLLNNKKK